MSEPRIKAIETRYKGYRFRSRLEARWAVFFDEMELRWEYEPEGFNLGNDGLYLPDFRLPVRFVMLIGTEEMRRRVDRLKEIAPSRFVAFMEWSKGDLGEDLENGLTIWGMPVFEEVYFEVKPPKPISDEEQKKIFGLAKQADRSVLIARGDPYEMCLLSVTHLDKANDAELGPHVDGGHRCFRASFTCSENGVANVLIQNKGCGDNEFFKVARSSEWEAYGAAVAARSARFEHGESPR